MFCDVKITSPMLHSLSVDRITRDFRITHDFHWHTEKKETLPQNNNNYITHS